MDSQAVNVVVGLGNPGAEYERTRHNIGFLVADAVIRRLRSVAERKAFYSRWATGRYAGRQVAVMQPQTYMNRSGEALAAAVRSGQCVPEQTLVVYDCLDLPFGRIRLRARGGSGGHRGLESILQHLEGEGLPRLRVGIGRPEYAGDSVDHVLGSWTPAEENELPEIVRCAADAVLAAVRGGVTEAMNRYNGLTLARPETEAAQTENNDTESEH